MIKYIFSNRKWLSLVLALALVASNWPAPAEASGPSMKWVTKGEPVLTSTGIPAMQLQVYNGTPYVAYLNASNHAIVKKMVNGVWEVVGEENIAGGTVASSIKFIIDNEGTPFVFFADRELHNDYATVMRYDATEDQWKAVGERGYSTSFAASPSFHAEDGVVYTAHLESNSRKLVITKGENGIWSVIGEFLETAPYSSQVPFVYVYGGVPYVAAIKMHDSDGALGLKVIRYVNGNWQEIGAANVPQEGATRPSLAMDANGVLYMSYRSSTGLQVTKYNEDTDVWQPVGAQAYTGNVQGNNSSLAIGDNGDLYVSFMTSAASGRLMRYSSTTEVWGQVGGNISMTGLLLLALDGNAPILAHGQITASPFPFVISVYAALAEADAAHNALTVEDELAQRFAGDELLLLASGDRADAAGIIAGDTRYIPATWTSTEPGQNGVFARDGDKYVSAYTPATAGQFTVTATFRKETWSGSLWVDAVEPDDKTLQLSVLHKPPVAPGSVLAVAGNGHADLSWGEVTDATEYRIYLSETEGVQGASLATVTGTTYTAGGLTNGTTYYFTVRAIGAGGEGAAATSGAVTPIAPPDAPDMVAAVFGNRQAELSWGATAGATEYRIYLSETEGVQGVSLATVTGTTYTAGGLTNGTTYYFTVRAIGAGGEGAAAVSSGVTPATVPGPPTGVTAIAGNGQATVSFTAPADHGGRAVVGYRVISSPAGGLAEGAASPIVVTGLTNGLDYTFTVVAMNSAGSSEASSESASVVPRKPPVVHVTAPSDSSGNGVSILVNGIEEHAGTATTGMRGDRTATTVAVNAQQMEDRLAAEGDGAAVVIPVPFDSDIVIGELLGRTIKHMEGRKATIVLRTNNATFKLPAEQLHIDAVAAHFGDTAALEDIIIQIEISEPNAGQIKAVENAMQREALMLAAPPVEFSVRAVYGGQSVEISRFNGFVERTIAIPEGGNPDKITTAVVIDEDGIVRHVPTKVEVVDGLYYATINSFTASVYALVWSPQQFADVIGHWGEAAVNNMGSRLVMQGMEDGSFRPQEAMTRGDYIASVVRALGLKPEQGAASFADAAQSDDYERATHTAFAYGLIDGYTDGTVRSQSLITREQAFTIAIRAMELTGLRPGLSEREREDILQSHLDAGNVSAWARPYVADIISTGVVTGRNGGLIDPQSPVTRAETAMLLQRLLQKSRLIDEDNE